MILKEKKYLAIIFLLLPSLLKADIIYVPHRNGGIALSYELIGSYEIALQNNNTISLWGGYGGVSMINEINYPAWGA